MWRHAVVLASILTLGTSVQGQEPRTLKGFGGWVGSLAFAPDSRQLAVGASDGSVTLWDVTTGQKLNSLEKHHDAVSALAWSPDGTSLASGGHDIKIMVHYLAKQKPYATLLGGHRGAVMTLVISPDGKRLYSGDMGGSIFERDYIMRRRKETTLFFDTISGFHTHSSWVNGLALDRAGTQLASGSSDNSLELRRAVDGKWQLQHTFRVKEGEIRSVALSPNGKLVAAGIRYGNVRVWDSDSNKEVGSFKPFTGETWAVAFTPDGKTLVAGGGDWNKPSDVRRWDVGSWKELTPLPHTGEVLCLVISPDGQWLAAGSWDRTVRIWKLPN